VIEMAMYSHNTTVDGLTATWWNGATDPAMKPLLKMGENQRDCSYSNMTIDAGNGKYFGMCIRFEHAFNNKISIIILKAKALPRMELNFRQVEMIQELQEMKYTIIHLYSEIQTIISRWKIHTAVLLLAATR